MTAFGRARRLRSKYRSMNKINAAALRGISALLAEVAEAAPLIDYSPAGAIGWLIEVILRVLFTRAG